MGGCFHIQIFLDFSFYIHLYILSAYPSHCGEAMNHVRNGEVMYQGSWEEPPKTVEKLSDGQVGCW